MIFKHPRLDRFYPPLIAVVLLLAAFGGYYFFYVRYQEDYYNRRSLRELAVITKQLQIELGRYRTVLSNRADHMQQCKTDKPATAADSCLNVSEFSCEDPAVESDLQRSSKRYINERVPGLTYVDPNDNPPKGEVSLVQENGIFWVYLWGEARHVVDNSPKRRIRLHAKAKLSDLGSNLVPTGQFDNVLFVDAGGTVIYQSGQAEFRATALPKIVSQGNYFATAVTDAEFGGTMYKIFMQPVRLPLPMRIDAVLIDEAAKRGEKNNNEDDYSLLTQTSTGRHWVICGLIEADRFRARTLAISPNVILWFALLLFLLILVWPFLRVYVMAPEERLGHREGLRLALATILGSAALTVWVTDVYFIERLKAQVDQALKVVAEQIEYNVERELGQIYRQLQKFGRDREQKLKSGCPHIHSRGHLLWKPDVAAAVTYRNLDMVFWANQSGCQIMKWSLRSKPTTFVSVKEREYFTRVREHRHDVRKLAVLPESQVDNNGDRSSDGRFWLDSLSSLTTGVNQAVFSMPAISKPSPRKSCDSANDAVMVAGVMRPLSLMEPVLPPGFKFAVIDRTGDVLFHSDVTRALIENFIAESDDNRALQAAIKGGIKKHIKLRYAGTNNRAYVQPLLQRTGLPWTLIVFHEMSSLQTMNLEVLTFSAILFLAFLVIFLIACYIQFALVLRSPFGFFARGSVASFWPDREREAAYWEVVVINVCLILVLSLWIIFGERSQLAIATCLIPPCGWLLTIFTIHHGRTKSKLKTVRRLKWIFLLLALGLLVFHSVREVSWERYVLWLGLATLALATFDFKGFQKHLDGATARIKSIVFSREPSTEYNPKYYLAALTAAFILASILPSIAFFKISYGLERELMAARAQVELRRTLEVRSERLRRKYSVVYSAASKTDYSDERLVNEDLDVYAHVHNGKEKSSSRCHPWIPCVTGDFMVSNATLPPTGWLQRFYRTVRPLYDEYAGETWGLLHSSLRQPVPMEKGLLKLAHSYAPGSGVQINSLLPDTSWQYMLRPIHTGEAHVTVPWRFWLLTFITCLMVGVIILLVFLGVRFIARNVFLMDIPRPVLPTLPGDLSKRLRGNLLVLGHPFSNKSQMLKDLSGWSEDSSAWQRNLHVYDMSKLGKRNESLDGLGIPQNKIIALDQFEYRIDDPFWCRAKLRLLEQLVYVRRKDVKGTCRNVLIVSAVDPVFYLANGGSGKPRNKEEPKVDLHRWAAVLSSFAVLYYERRMGNNKEIVTIATDFGEKTTYVPSIAKIKGTSNDGDNKSARAKNEGVAGTDQSEHNFGSHLVDRLNELLKSECDRNIALRDIAGEIVKGLPKDGTLRRNQLASIIYDRCEAYYRSLWTTCSMEEKLLLIHLAEEGYVNRKNEPIIRHLTRRGLVERKPHLQLMNGTFERFVHVARGEEDSQRWEMEGGRKGWMLWRPVMIVTLVMLVLFFVWTQREYMASWIPMIVTFASVLVGLVQLVMAFRPDTMPVSSFRS